MSVNIGRTPTSIPDGPQGDIWWRQAARFPGRLGNMGFPDEATALAARGLEPFTVSNVVSSGGEAMSEASTTAVAAAALMLENF